ncbi:MAG: DUF2293 domain-containing protein [Magnetospirillum sp.]|nr:DUF2293 domain-containing protein [Magnetospirillum sp.]
MNHRRAAIAQALAVLAPHIPKYDREAVLDRAEDSSGLRHASPQAAAWLALTSHIRHTHTDYDRMLDDGYDADSARHFCTESMRQVLMEWGCRKAF